MTDRPVIKIAPADLPSDMNIEERLVALNDQVLVLSVPIVAKAAPVTPVVFTTSTPLNPQSSITNQGDISKFSYTSTDTTITVTWLAFTVYRPDQSTISVLANSVGVVFAGLTASTNYHFGVYVNPNGVVSVIMSDTSTSKGSIAWQVQTINADGHTVVSVDYVLATVASGGTGGGGGTGGPSCFSGNTRLKDGRRFDSLAGVVEVETLRGARRAELLVSDYDGGMIDMGDGELVTLEHPFYCDGVWIPANKYLLANRRVHFVGKVYNLHVVTDSDDERNYYLANGKLAHNFSYF